jgi:hypothetical protein
MFIHFCIPEVSSPNFEYGKDSIKMCKMDKNVWSIECQVALAWDSFTKPTHFYRVDTKTQNK